MNARMCVLFAGWWMAWYGVYRRDLRGRIIALAGAGFALGAMTLPEHLCAKKISSGT